MLSCVQCLWFPLMLLCRCFAYPTVDAKLTGTLRNLNQWHAHAHDGGSGRAHTGFGRFAAMDVFELGWRLNLEVCCISFWTMRI